MTQTHTPGPWRTSDAAALYPDAPIRILQGAQNISDALSPSYTCVAVANGGSPEAKANARLIAAAPDLLAALADAEFLLRKAAQLAGPMQDSFKRCAADARAAIAKAEGRA